MTELLTKDLYWILRRTPRCVISLMECNAQVFMAGGFIRAHVANEEAQDIDLFAPDEERASLYARILAGTNGSLFKTKNAYTVRAAEYSLPIQVIHRWTYTKPEELIQSFDFTVAKTVIWCSGKRDELAHRVAWHSLTHENFYADLAAKRLAYTRPQRNEDAGGSLLRVLKFYQKGYRIPLDSLSAVVARMLVGVEPAQVNDIMLQLACTKEEALTTVITALLHEVDPQQDPQHLFHLPSEADA
jgi:hypothetical protein